VNELSWLRSSGAILMALSIGRGREGERGPPGLEGPAGEPRVDGTDGVDGENDVGESQTAMPCDIGSTATVDVHRVGATNSNQDRCWRTASNHITCPQRF
jgi:hypothetical protein